MFTLNNEDACPLSPQIQMLTGIKKLIFANLPNPKLRFCIDLTHKKTLYWDKYSCADSDGDVVMNVESSTNKKSSSAKEKNRKANETKNNWLAAKKVRRFLTKIKDNKQKAYKILVNEDIAETYDRIRAHHIKEDNGEWMNDTLKSYFLKLRECNKSEDIAGERKTDVRIYAIELWEYDIIEDAANSKNYKKSRPLAAILSLSSHNVFHDVSMATYVKDDRSYGMILTKIVGHVLQNVCGFHLWYWGFKNKYMDSFDSKYLTVHIPRSEFFFIWKGLSSPLLKSNELSNAKKSDSAFIPAARPSGRASSSANKSTEVVMEIAEPNRLLTTKSFDTVFTSYLD